MSKYRLRHLSTKTMKWKSFSISQAMKGIPIKDTLVVLCDWNAMVKPSTTITLPFLSVQTTRPSYRLTDSSIKYSLSMWFSDRIFVEDRPSRYLEDGWCRGCQRKNWLTNIKDRTSRDVRTYSLLPQIGKSCRPCQLPHLSMCFSQQQVLFKGQLTDWISPKTILFIFHSASSKNKGPVRFLTET